jgi:hypothetical protein
VTETNDRDVLQGRGSGSNLYQGNMVYRDMIDEVATSYTTTTSRKEKNRLVNELIGVIHGMKGRFLHPLDSAEVTKLGLDSNKDFYFEIADADAVDKVKQAIRYVHYKKRPMMEQRRNASAAGASGRIGNSKSVSKRGAGSVDGGANKKMPAKKSRPASVPTQIIVSSSSGNVNDSAALHLLQSMQTPGSISAPLANESSQNILTSGQPVSSNEVVQLRLLQLLSQQRQNQPLDAATAQLNTLAEQMQPPQDVNLNLQNFLRLQQQPHPVSSATELVDIVALLQKQAQQEQQGQELALQQLLDFYQRQQQVAQAMLQQQLLANQQQSTQSVCSVLHTRRQNQPRQQSLDQTTLLLAALAGGLGTEQQANAAQAISNLLSGNNLNSNQTAATGVSAANAFPNVSGSLAVPLLGQIEQILQNALPQHTQNLLSLPLASREQREVQQTLNLLLLRQQQQDSALSGFSSQGQEQPSRHAVSDSAGEVSNASGNDNDGFPEERKRSHDASSPGKERHDS